MKFVHLNVHSIRKHKNAQKRFAPPSVEGRDGITPAILHSGVLLIGHSLALASLWGHKKAMAEMGSTPESMYTEGKAPKSWGGGAGAVFSKKYHTQFHSNPTGNPVELLRLLPKWLGIWDRNGVFLVAHNERGRMPAVSRENIHDFRTQVAS